MTTVSSNTLTTGIIVLAVIVIIMVRRTIALHSGTPYSGARVFGYGAFQTFLFLFFGASTIYVAYGTWGPIGLSLIAPYALVVIGAALVAEPRVRRRVQFETREGGQVYYRLPIVIPLITLVLFAVRLSVEIALFGLAAVFTFTFPTTLPLGALALLIVVDLLYGASVGILYGRGFAIRAAYRQRATPPAEPQPLA